MCYTDDPARDYDRYCEEQQDELDKLPKCDYCNEPIQDDFCYEINDAVICEECLMYHHRKQTDDYVE